MTALQILQLLLCHDHSVVAGKKKPCFKHVAHSIADGWSINIYSTCKSIHITTAVKQGQTAATSPRSVCQPQTTQPPAAASCADPASLQ